MVLIVCFFTLGASCVFAQTWPDSPEKQNALEHSAQLLLSSFDTNQMEMAYGKLTDQPETVLALRDLSKEIISNFNAIAISLTKPDENTKTYINNFGRVDYQATISNPDNSKEIYFVIFRSKNGIISQFDKREKSDEGKNVLYAHFYENGKLRDLRDLEGKNDFTLLFNKDGTLEGCDVNSKVVLPKL